eukprot:14504699-Alexandrium_andersonii.AAC.1
MWSTRRGCTPRTPSNPPPAGKATCRPPWASPGTRGGGSRERRHRVSGTAGSSSRSSAPARSARRSR